MKKIIALAATLAAGGAILGTSLSAGASTASTSTVVKTAKIGNVTVLTNGQGRTLYWFAPDTATKSTCYGTCAFNWPPVTGPVTRHPRGINGTFGTIIRAGGQTQATYSRHPLYTFVGDSRAGQATGNDLNQDGGLWYEVSVSR